uniref:Uncharacterized protein n=1 Tax=viral metagenome TaxID=1070528 RepID=A0A6C0CFN5_9ZZZZ
MGNVHGIMTRDAISRKIRSWPILSDAEMAEMADRTARLRDGTENPEGGYPISHHLYDFQLPEISWKTQETVALNVLEARFPHSIDLLKHFRGRIMAAGGAVFKALYADSADDIDFFFVDPEVEHLAPSVAKERYDNLLAEAIAFLSSRWLAAPMKADYIDATGQETIGNVHVMRSEFVTTVRLISNHFYDIKYQFIHRVYPSIGSVLGGFDLGPAMVATDGYRLLATELGAYSAFSRIILMDTSRRSTSFEHRLGKYARLCRLVLPGLDPGIIKTVIKRKPAKEIVARLDRIADGAGLTAKCDQYDPESEFWEQEYVIRENSVFFLNEEPASRAAVIKKMEKTANKLGYNVRGMNLLELTPKKFGNVEDVIHCLEKIAEDSGYRYDHKNHAAHIFVSAINSYKAQLAFEMRILTQKRPVLRLPCANINLEMFVPDHDQNSDHLSWVISPAKTNRVAKKCDYGSNRVWSAAMITLNITMLLGGNLSSVTSGLILKSPGSPIITNYGRPEDLQPQEIFAFNSLYSCAADVQTDDSIKEAIMNSFVQPKFGETEATIDYFKVQTLFFRRLFDRGFANLGYKETILGNLEIVRKRLTGVSWILTNPGRQWTSSINPIMGDPREWYGEYYKSFRLGCIEVETCLRLMRLRPGQWKNLPKDIFGLIVRLIVWENSYLITP